MKNHSLSPPSKKQNSSHRNVRAVCFLLLFTDNIREVFFELFSIAILLAVFYNVGYQYD